MVGGNDTAKLPRGLSGARLAELPRVKTNMNRSDPQLNDRITEDDLNERVKMSQRNLLGPESTNQIIKDDEDENAVV